MIDLNKIQASIVARFQTTASDDAFKTEQHIEHIYADYSIKRLSYSQENSFKNDGEKTFSFNDVPEGMSFVLGKKYFYIEFYFAVNGDEVNSSNLGKSTEFRINGLTYNPNNSQKYFVFRRYSQVPFIGNDELLEQLNNEAKLKKDFIERSIDDFNQHVTEANIKIREIVQHEFLKEKQKRDLRTNSLNKLNPF